MDVIFWGGILLVVVLFFIGVKVLKKVAWGLAIVTLLFILGRWLL
jgi:hypothetical protein